MADRQSAGYRSRRAATTSSTRLSTMAGIMLTHLDSCGLALAFVRPPVNDNLAFGERVKAEIVADAHAVGVTYSARELYAFAAAASEVAQRAAEQPTEAAAQAGNTRLASSTQ